jgi:hypothetical protein
MKHHPQIGIKQFLLAAATGLLVLPLILYGRLSLLRPPRTNLERSLFQGIDYRRDARSTPRPIMLHIVSIDLTAPGLKVLVTPGGRSADDTEIAARTTSEFVSEFKLQLAINASFFYPFREETPWDYYPHSGDRVNALGQAISNGSSYSPAERKWYVLCFDGNNHAQIESSGKCPEGTAQAVAGNEIVLEQGKSVNSRSSNSSNRDKPYPRVAVAIDQKGQKLWLIAVDGKQPLYSEGVTIAELTEITRELGAYSALSLDGGGSTTLVTATSQEPTLLNAPIQAKLPMRQRPVANHLGFYALPKN